MELLLFMLSLVSLVVVSIPSKVCPDTACYFCGDEQIDDHSQLKTYSDISLKGDCPKCHCRKLAYLSWN